MHRINVVVEWLRQNPFMTVGIVAAATLLSALLTAVITLTSTWLKWRLDQRLAITNALRSQQLQHLNDFMNMVDATVRWHQQFKAKAAATSTDKIVSVLEAMYATKPVFYLNITFVSVMTNNKSRAELTLIFQRLADAHGRISEAVGAYSTSKFTQPLDESPFDDFNAAAVLFYQRLLDIIYS